MTMPPPIHSVTVVAADFPGPQEYIDFLDNNMRAAMDRMTRLWLPAVLDGHTFNWQHHGIFRSQKTLRQLQATESGEFVGDQLYTDSPWTSEPRPGGFYANVLLDELTKFPDGTRKPEWPAWEDEANGLWHMWIIQVAEGEGVAGGSCESGIVLMGDWGSSAAYRGIAAPSCEKRYGAYFCTNEGFTKTPTGALQHECFHMFCCDSHSPVYIYGESSIDITQKTDILTNKAKWLYVPEPTPEPMLIPTLTGIRVSPVPVLRVGQSVDVDVYAQYSDGSETNVNYQDTLSVIDARIAKVDQEANILTGMRQGTTELIAGYGTAFLHVPVSVKKRRWW